MKNEDKREKIRILSEKDLDISYFVGSGKGGQKKQKTHSGVQILHRESGAIGRASDTRSLQQNKKAAFERMRHTLKFKMWLNKKIFEIREQETMEEQIIKSITPENIKLGVKDENGKWKIVDDEYFNTENAKKENDYNN